MNLNESMLIDIPVRMTKSLSPVTCEITINPDPLVRLVELMEASLEAFDPSVHKLNRRVLGSLENAARSVEAMPSYKERYKLDLSDLIAQISDLRESKIDRKAFIEIVRSLLPTVVEAEKREHSMLALCKMMSKMTSEQLDAIGSLLGTFGAF